MIGTSRSFQHTTQIHINSYNSQTGVTFRNGACVFANTDYSKKYCYEIHRFEATNTTNKTSHQLKGFHPIDIYCNIPYGCEDMTLTHFFERFDMEKKCQRNVSSFVKYMLGFHIYETYKITRFIDFHPTNNLEIFFFNMLLRTIPFKNANGILFDIPKNKSYIRECQDCGIVNLDMHHSRDFIGVRTSQPHKHRETIVTS